MRKRFVFVGTSQRMLRWVEEHRENWNTLVEARDSIILLTDKETSHRLLGYDRESAGSMQVIWDAPPNPDLANYMHAHGFNVPAIAFGADSSQRWMSQQIDVLNRQNAVLRDIIAELAMAYQEINKIYESHQDADPDDLGMWWDDFEDAVLNFETAYQNARTKMPKT